MATEGPCGTQEIGVGLDDFGTGKHFTQQLRHRCLFLRTDTTAIKIDMTDVLDGEIRQEFLVQDLTDLVVGLMDGVDTLCVETRGG